MNDSVKPAPLNPATVWLARRVVGTQRRASGHLITSVARAVFLSCCASVEKEAPDQNTVMAEQHRDGTDGERHNQPEAKRRSLVA
jgi:hypothetical protein